MQRPSWLMALTLAPQNLHFGILISPYRIIFSAVLRATIPYQFGVWSYKSTEHPIIKDMAMATHLVRIIELLGPVFA
jgi:hypothetical protein